MDFAIYESASDNAPPISVVGVEANWASVVELSSRDMFCNIAFSTIAKGLYLFAFSDTPFPFGAPFISTSPFVSVLHGVRLLGVGYSHSARWGCDAITATSFAFPEARCAFMKTRRLAIADESGRVLDRCAQACGFVSRTIARRDGGGPEANLVH